MRPIHHLCKPNLDRCLSIGETPDLDIPVRPVALADRRRASEADGTAEAGRGNNKPQGCTKALGFGLWVFSLSAFLDVFLLNHSLLCRHSAP